MMVQFLMENALEAEQARSLGAGLTSSGEYIVENSLKPCWDDDILVNGLR